MLGAGVVAVVAAVAVAVTLVLTESSGAGPTRDVYLANVAAVCRVYGPRLDRIRPPDVAEPANVIDAVARVLPLIRAQLRDVKALWTAGLARGGKCFAHLGQSPARDRDRLLRVTLSPGRASDFSFALAGGLLQPLDIGGMAVGFGDQLLLLFLHRHGPSRSFGQTLLGLQAARAPLAGFAAGSGMTFAVGSGFTGPSGRTGAAIGDRLTGGGSLGPRGLDFDAKRVGIGQRREIAAGGLDGLGRRFGQGDEIGAPLFQP